MKPELLTLFIVLALFLTVPHASHALVDKIVAVVDEEVITYSDLEEGIFPFYVEYRKLYKGEELTRRLEEAKTSILARLIDAKLIYGEARRIGFEASAERIEERAARIKESFKNEEEFQRVLQARGLSLKGWKKRIKEQVAVEEMVKVAINAQIAVMPAETTEYYREHLDEFGEPEAVKITSVFFSGDDKEKVFRVACDTLDRLKEEELSRLVKEISDEELVSCKADSRWVKRGEMKPEIDKLIFSLRPGEYSGITKSESGCYIFKVEDKKAGEVKEYSAVEDEIKNRVYSIKRDKRYTEWIEELRSDAYISIK